MCIAGRGGLGCGAAVFGRNREAENVSRLRTARKSYASAAGRSLPQRRPASVECVRSAGFDPNRVARSPRIPRFTFGQENPTRGTKDAPHEAMKHPIESPRRRLAAKLLAAAVAVRRAGAAPTRVALPSLLAVAAAFALLLTAAAQQPDKLRLDLPDSLSLRLHGLDTLPLPAGDLRMQAPPVSWRPPLILSLIHI